MMALGDCWKQLSWFYYQYLLVTALYMLEPWERTVFNSLLISVAAMAIYTGYVFMPQHIMAILHYFEVIQWADAPSCLPARPVIHPSSTSSNNKAGSAVLEAIQRLFSIWNQTLEAEFYWRRSPWLQLIFALSLWLKCTLLLEWCLIYIIFV